MTEDINFDSIRPFKGDQRKGFEELCCQLYSLEPPEPEAKFIRKGGDFGDAGVECYWILGDGSEHGLQAKYFTRFRDDQWGQIDASVKTALSKHPKLTKYVVCIPNNLHDRRATRRSGKKEVSQQKRWDKHVDKWKRLAREKGMEVEFVLWNAFELTKRLTSSDPLYSGRALYWFDTKILSPEWFREKFEIARQDLHDRYTPEFHVDLPLSELFHALSWDEIYPNKFRSHWMKINNAAEEFRRSLHRNPFEEINDSIWIKAYDRSVALGAIARGLSDIIPTHPTVESYRQNSAEAVNAIFEVQNFLFQLDRERDDDSKDEKKGRDVQHVRRVTNKLVDAVSSFRNLLESKYLMAGAVGAALIKGGPGVGKSHYLCETANKHTAQGLPAILLLGHYFGPGNPWDHVLSRLDLRNHTVEVLLGALDGAAQAFGTRTLILIDAINEGRAQLDWQGNLAGFLQQIARFPRIAVVLSCRAVYERRIVPPSIDEKALVRIEHRGFSGQEHAAAAIYFDQRGIDRLSSPILAPEFSNPLFLKTCSDALVRRGEKSLPKGINGVSAIFEFYAESLEQALVVKLSLDNEVSVAKRSLLAIAGELAKKGKDWITKETTLSCLAKVLPGKESELLDALKQEGALIDEPIYENEDDEFDIGIDTIKFTYQRFSDHFISRRVLRDHFDTSSPESSFQEDASLLNFISSKNFWDIGGIIEMMSIQVPEICGRELIAILPERLQELWTVRQAFMESILWRRPDCITDETISWFNEVEHYLGSYALEETLLRVATEPEHRLNADFLHENLLRKSMPDRDATWSIALARMYSDEEETALSTLINWAWEGNLHNVEEKRIKLCATALAWLFTTSHRQLRDRATKALVNLLINRLQVAKALLEKFGNVDDLYVHDRLFAAAYGAALNSSNIDYLPELSELVYEKVFKEGSPAPHILLRDYARGIIELANYLGRLPATIKLDRVRPPYKSEWPLQIPSEDDLKPLKKAGSYGIYSSTLHSDFNWYTINSVQKWSATPLSELNLRKSGFDYEEFVKRLFARGNKDEIEVFSQIDTSQTEIPEGDIPTAFFNIHLKEEKKEWDKIRLEIDAGQKRKDELENKLLSLLPTEEAKIFKDKVKQHIDYVTHRQDKSGIVYGFLKSDAARWICKRAYDFGWAEEKFGEVDSNMRHSLGRSRPVVERVGKKYQYLAYYELLSRLSDNLYMMPDYHSDEPPKFDGPWQLNKRDVDPSLLIRKTEYDGWADHGKATWWKPQRTMLGESEVAQRTTWLWSDEDIPSIENQLIVPSPHTHSDWVMLDLFWMTWEPNDGTADNAFHNREVWLRIQSGLVRRNDLPKLVTYLKDKKNLRPGDEFKAAEIWGSFYLAEYPWHPSVTEISAGWDTASDDKHWGLPVDSLTLTTEYHCERGTHDLSVDEGIMIKIPSPWLMRRLGLRLVDGRNIHYVDPDGKTAFFDPSITVQGPSASLTHKDLLRKLLKDDDLVLVWVIGGEKNVYQPLFYGRNCYSGVYYWDGEAIEGEKWFFEERPEDGPRKI